MDTHSRITKAQGLITGAIIEHRKRKGRGRAKLAEASTLLTGTRGAFALKVRQRLAKAKAEVYG